MAWTQVRGSCFPFRSVFHELGCSLLPWLLLWFFSTVWGWTWSWCSSLTSLSAVALSIFTMLISFLFTSFPGFTSRPFRVIDVSYQMLTVSAFFIPFSLTIISWTALFSSAGITTLFSLALARISNAFFSILMLSFTLSLFIMHSFAAFGLFHPFAFLKPFLSLRLFFASFCSVLTRLASVTLRLVWSSTCFWRWRFFPCERLQWFRRGRRRLTWRWRGLHLKT